MWKFGENMCYKGTQMLFIFCYFFRYRAMFLTCPNKETRISNILGCRRATDGDDEYDRYFLFYFPHLHHLHKMRGKFERYHFHENSRYLKNCLSAFLWNLDCRRISVAGWLNSNLRLIKKQGCQKFTKSPFITIAL